MTGHIHPRLPRRSRRGSAIVVVLWAISMAAIIVASVQISSFRAATFGHDALGRVQARWAARAGLENTIATIALNTTDPIQNDALAMQRDLEFASSFELWDVRYDIQHHYEGLNLAGPLDEHSKLNVNGDMNDLGMLEDLTIDVAAAIRDWSDRDTSSGLLGAEDEYYRSLRASYLPRNAPFRSVAELELVAGIWGDQVRGEDWNMNYRMDPNENDGDRSPPEDEPDGILDLAWGGLLTVHSVAGGATLSGQPRLYLGPADPGELADRCGLTEEQSELLISFGMNESNTLESLITTALPGTGQGGDEGGGVEPLTTEQISSILAETQILPLYERTPGKLNLNTTPAQVIRDLLESRGFDMAMAEEIIYLRDSRPEGLVSILELSEIPEMTPQLVQQLATVFTTSSNVFTVSSRGRSSVTGLEVEIIAVIDRSTMPVKIIEYREQ